MWVAMLASLATSGILCAWILKNWIYQAMNLTGTVNFLWTAHFLFWLMCIYYFGVWLVSDLVAEWYIEKNEGSAAGSLCRLARYHVGSVVLAAIIAPTLKILELLVRSTKPNECFVNPCSRIILCFTAPCLELVEYYSLILNRGAFTLMAIQGNSYFKSSRSTGVLIYHDR